MHEKSHNRNTSVMAFLLSYEIGIVGDSHRSVLHSGCGLIGVEEVFVSDGSKAAVYDTAHGCDAIVQYGVGHSHTVNVGSVAHVAVVVAVEFGLMRFYFQKSLKCGAYSCATKIHQQIDVCCIA